MFFWEPHRPAGVVCDVLVRGDSHDVYLPMQDCVESASQAQPTRLQIQFEEVSP